MFVTAVMLGSYCKNDSECQQVKFSKCSELKVCICSFNTMAINRTTCVPLLGVPCQVNEHCKVNNSICVDNECQCEIKALIHNDNECALRKFSFNMNYFRRYNEFRL